MKDITILKKYLQKNRDIYSQLSLFEYKCEGDTATLTRNLYTEIPCIMILRKSLDFLKIHKNERKCVVEEDLKKNGYYIQIIEYQYADPSDKLDILIKEDNIILRYPYSKKKEPYIKTLGIEPCKV